MEERLKLVPGDVIWSDEFILVSTCPSCMLNLDEGVLCEHYDIEKLDVERSTVISVLEMRKLDFLQKRGDDGLLLLLPDGRLAWTWRSFFRQ